MEFMREIYEQRKLTLSYNMTDERYCNSFNELLSTFCMRVFKNMVPIFLGVLDKMKTDFYFEKKLCLSNGKL